MANLNELCTKLRLPYIKENYKDLIKEAQMTDQSHKDFLEQLLENEYLQKSEKATQTRIRSARFPQKYFLLDFDKSVYDPKFIPEFQKLETLDFIKAKENIILIGAAGAGKTHYATALGIEAAMKGFSVLFTTVPNLVVELREGMAKSQMTNFRKKFEKYNLVILDELGYFSFDKECGELLFNLISSRNNKGSIIVTSNLNFNEWGQTFKDTKVAGALVDRLCCRAHVLELEREIGGRMQMQIDWLKANKK